ncbi:unnamed protein product [Aureobasidium vineae]|uniref:Pentatricopeptide repeat-containing protein-mitochondrial domain-containing protein n=1 Tax=Aureobasidium vineae TaxID=2773715 RepID=A0A9N8JNE4_9PEZI|nr:unnamed protein product [Aureobasidium vineae]
MSSTTPRLVADGLWHCLCPSYTSAPLLSTRHALIRRRRPALQCAATRTRPPAVPRYNSTVSPVRFSENIHVPPRSQESGRPATNAFVPLDEQRYSKGHDTTMRTIVRPKATIKKEEFYLYSTPDLYELAHAAAAKENSREAMQIVEYLVRVRRETPNLRLYSISILANVHPTEGSARSVARLLAEMEDEGLQMNVQICHDALRVLSVHMDYLLRIDILQYMRRQWLQLTTEGYHWVGAALFREGQLEMGRNHLEEMRKDNVPIQGWLYDIALYTMLEMKEFDEALLIVKDRVAANDWIANRNIWAHMLDCSAAFFHHPSTVYVWNSQVIPGYLIPSSGTCLNVLTTAARKGDAALATSVFHVLGKRSTTFRQIHYDQLLTTYMSASPPDLHAAFTVLTIMANVKIPPTSVSTRPIFTHLVRNPSECTTAFDIITSLHESGREIPIAALNVLMEGFVESGQLEQALVTYKHMHLYERLAVDRHGKPIRRSGSYSNLETFNVLLRGVAKPNSQQAYDLAMFLVSEMLELGVQPNALVYERLVLICVHDAKLDHAYRYFDEMDELGFIPRPFTAGVLAESLAERADNRFWEVLQRMQDRGAGLAENKKEFLQRTFSKAMKDKEGELLDTAV